MLQNYYMKYTKINYINIYVCLFTIIINKSTLKSTQTYMHKYTLNTTQMYK